jgi:hypothetical protein
VPVCSALPIAVDVLPGLFGCDRDRDNEGDVRRLVSFGVVAGEADDRELVHGVHVGSPFLLPVCSGGNRTASGPAPNRRRRALLAGSAFRFLCRSETCRGNRQSTTQTRAGRVGSSAAGALDTRAEDCGELRQDQPQPRTRGRTKQAPCHDRTAGTYGAKWHDAGGLCGLIGNCRLPLPSSDRAGGGCYRTVLDPVPNATYFSEALRNLPLNWHRQNRQVILSVPVIPRPPPP